MAPVAAVHKLHHAPAASVRPNLPTKQPGTGAAPRESPFLSRTARYHHIDATQKLQPPPGATDLHSERGSFVCEIVFIKPGVHPANPLLLSEYSIKPKVY